jgi:hypothetical protein
MLFNLWGVDGPAQHPDCQRVRPNWFLRVAAVQSGSETNPNDMTGFVRPFSCLIDLDISNSLTFQVYATGHHLDPWVSRNRCCADCPKSRVRVHLLRQGG